MALVQCLFCNAGNDPAKTGAYCDTCGKKLQTSLLIQKRSFARTGGDADPESPRSASSRTFEAMLTATVLQIFGGGLFLILGSLLFDKVPAEFPATVFSWSGPPTVVLGCLAFLSRRWSAAPVVATALFGLWLVATFVLDPAFALRWLIPSAPVQIALVVAAIKRGP